MRLENTESIRKKVNTGATATSICGQKEAVPHRAAPSVETSQTLSGRGRPERGCVNHCR